MEPGLTDTTGGDTSPAPTGPRGRNPRRGRVALGALFLLTALTCAGLGIWQIQRLFWKLDLIARVEARAAAAPTAPPGPAEWPHLAGDALEYRRVTLIGTFRHDRETLVQAVTELGPGFWVLTPLVQTDRTTFLVNRGFVPPERRDPATRAAGNVTGSLTVTGLLRLSEPNGGFLRANAPAEERWYSRDVTAIAAARGLSGTAPFFIDAGPAPNPGGAPVGGLTVLGFRNPHLVYALTWFALALLGAGGLAVLLRERRNTGENPPLGES